MSSVLDAALGGPMPGSFTISSFPAPATTSTKPTPRTVTLEQLVKLLTTHERRKDKDGRGWSGAIYKPGTTRANANVVEWSVAGADIEHVSMDEYMEMRTGLVSAGLAVILYSTYRSTPEDFRFRLAIPFVKPVPKGQYADVWHRMNAALFLGKNDPQTKDPSRMLYTPAAPADVAVVAEYVPGLALDWEALPEAPVSSGTATNGTVTSGQTVGVSRDVLLFTIEGAPDGQQRGMALRAARSFLSDGKNVDEAVELVWRGLQASPLGDTANPWTEEHARQLVASIAASPAPPPIHPSALKSVVLDGRNEARLPLGEWGGRAGDTPDDPSEKDPSRTTHLTRTDESIPLFRTAREIAASSPAATEWVVTAYVAQTAITELAGRLKASGKTTLLLALVAAVIQGRPFLSMATNQTGVVVLTEQNAASFRTALDRAGLLERDDVLVLFWHDVRTLSWPLVVQMAAAECHRRGYALLIVDTLSQFAAISGDGENNAGAALEAMRPLQEAAASGLAIIVSRHERKGGGDVGESGRGSSAFSGTADIVLSLRRPEGQASPTVRVVQALSRFDETPAELMIDLADGGYRALGTAQDVKAQEARRLIVEQMPSAETDALTTAELLETLAEARLKRTLVFQVLDDLRESGAVEHSGAGKRGAPFRYWRPLAADSSAPPVRADESADKNVADGPEIVDEVL